jgi:hypothetical protein
VPFRSNPPAIAQKGEGEKFMKLMKATLMRLWHLTRATSIAVSLAVVVALVGGVVSGAVAATPTTTTATAILKGVSNTASTVTTLINTGSGPALSLQSQSGHPPLAVNSETRVDHLNADKLDGQDSGAFLGAHGTADNATNAANADTLDHKDSTDFLAANGTAVDALHADQADQATNATNAANADTLDHKDSSAFAAKAEAPGADATHTNGISIGEGNWETVASVTVTAPADGFVIVTGSGYFTKGGFTQHLEGDRDSFAAALWSGSEVVIDSESAVFWTLPAQLHTGDYSGPFSTTKMYPVTAGNRTFYLRTIETNTSGVSGAIGNANITAYYVKNRF